MSSHPRERSRPRDHDAAACGPEPEGGGVEPAAAEKRARLVSILQGYGSALLGYSGGVDSAYLAKAALDALGRERFLAVTAISPSYPRAQREVAHRIVRQFGLPHLEIETEEWADPRYAANPTNRCYFCKTELFDRLCALARVRGLEAVCDGANADDAEDYRPGTRAARERGVRSPLQEAGLTKAEIRALSRAEGLPTWDLPASPCLASRIPYGIAVTPERLAEIERAEEGLRALRAWRGLRVRHHGEFARIEVDPSDLAAFADVALRRRAVRAVAAAGFDSALLDLEGYRRGSLNEGVVIPLGRPASTENAHARLERRGPEGEVGVPDLTPAAMEALLRDAGARGRMARSKPAGVRFLALDLSAWVGDEALRRAESAGG